MWAWGASRHKERQPREKKWSEKYTLRNLNTPLAPTLFSEETLKEKIREYLKTNRSINRRVLEREFYIRKQTALNWLNRLVDSGFLIKEGARNSPVYFLAEE